MSYGSPGQVDGYRYMGQGPASAPNGECDCTTCCCVPFGDVAAAHLAGTCNIAAPTAPTTASPTNAPSVSPTLSPIELYTSVTVTQPDVTAGDGLYTANGRINFVSTTISLGGEDVSAHLRTNWTAASITDSTPLPLTATNLLTTSNTPSLGLAPCGLESSQSYMFTVTTWLPAAPGVPAHWSAAAAVTTEVAVTTRANPSLGSLTVSPASGEALVTNFLLQAPSWQPGTNGATPLSYAFAYLPDGGGSLGGLSACELEDTVTQLSGAQAGASVTRVFPAGSHTLTLIVTDAVGGVGLATAALEATPTTVDASVAGASIDSANVQLDAGDYSGVASYVAPLTDTLNDDLTTLSSDEQAEVRQDVANLMAGAAAAVEADATNAGVAADSKLVDQLTGAVTSAVAATAQVTNVTADKGAETLAALLAARREDGVSTATKGNMIKALSSLLEATDDADGADGRLGGQSQVNLFSKITSNLPTLAKQMRVTAVPFEVTTASSRAAGIATTKRPPESLAGTYAAPELLDANGEVDPASAGYLTVPDGVAGALGGGALVDVSIISSTINVHQGEASEPAGTQVSDVLFAVDGGAPSSLQGLSSDLDIGIPLGGNPPDPAACATDADCGVRLSVSKWTGTCTNGTCACTGLYGGADCTLELACSYWDEGSGAWSQYGVTTVGLEALGDNASALSCRSNHTTEFAGMYIPTSASEWSENLPVPAAPCAEGWLAKTNWDENVTVYTTIVVVSIANLLLLPLFRLRYLHRYKKSEEKLAAGFSVTRVRSWKKRKKKVAPSPDKQAAVSSTTDGEPTSPVPTPPPSPPDEEANGEKKVQMTSSTSEADLSESSKRRPARPSFRRAGTSFNMAARETGKRTVETTRDRHTIFSVTNPLDLDITDPMHLRDEQLCQIFFNALLAELVLVCVWVNAVTITTNGTLDIRNMMIVGFSSSVQRESNAIS